MTTTNKILIGCMAVIALLGLSVLSTYNNLITLDSKVDQSYSQVEVQYQRRFDLVPNVVATVEGARNFEKSTLEAVVAARSAWANASTQGGKVQAAGQFDSALSRLLVTVESYPQLTATQAFRDLTVTLEGSENRVAFARNEYVASATAYNTAARVFPGNVVASLFGFDAKKELFAATTGASDAPKVDFDAAQ